MDRRQANSAAFQQFRAIRSRPPPTISAPSRTLGRVIGSHAEPSVKVRSVRAMYSAKAAIIAKVVGQSFR